VKSESFASFDRNMILPGKALSLAAEQAVDLSRVKDLDQKSHKVGSSSFSYKVAKAYPQSYSTICH